MGLLVAMLFSSLFLTAMATVTKLIIAKPLDIETLSSKSLPVYTMPRNRSVNGGNRNSDSYAMNFKNYRGPKMNYPKFATADNKMNYQSVSGENNNGASRDYAMFGGKNSRKFNKDSKQTNHKSKGRGLKNQDEVAIIAIPIKIESKGIKGIMNGKSVQTLMNGIHSYDPSANFGSFKGDSDSYETETSEPSNYDAGNSGRISQSLYEEIQGSSPNVFEIDKDSSARGYEVVKVVKAPSHNMGGYQVVREMREPVVQVVKEIVKEPAPRVTYQVVKEVVKQPSIQLVRDNNPQQIIYEIDRDNFKPPSKGRMKYQLVNSDDNEDGKDFESMTVTKGNGNKKKGKKNLEDDDEDKNSNNNQNNPMNGMMFHPMMAGPFNPMMASMMGMRGPNMMNMGPMGGPSNNQMMNMMKMQAMMMRMRQMQAMQQRQQMSKGGISPNMMNMMNMMNMRGMQRMRGGSSNNMMMMMNTRPNGGYQRRPSMNMMTSPYGNGMRTSASMMARSPLMSPLMNLMKPGGMIPSLPFKIPTFAALSPNPKRLAAALLGAMIR